MNYIIRIRQIVATYSRNDLNGLIICEKSADMKKKQVLKTPYRYLSLSRNYPKKSKHVDIWPVFFTFFLRRKTFCQNTFVILFLEGLENHLVELIKTFI